MNKFIDNAAEGIKSGLILAGVLAGLYIVWRFSDAILTVLCVVVPVVLIAGFIATHVFGPKRGVNIGGIHYEDFWSDD